ncbi:DnaJsubfamily B member 12 [Hordeum vulgare]|nr:DnaJsubfamily B member 12 [Hordeum vulgare]
MECNKDEALRAKEIAERKFQSRDLQGAKKFALKAKALFPDLEGIVQMITTLDVYLTSEVKIAGEKDWYSILSVDTSADDETLKKQYRKLLLQLHPDKNKSVGAEGAFQMVQEAWTVLSDKTKRALFDQKRKLIVMQQKRSQSNKTSAAPCAANGFEHFAAKAPASKASANKEKTGSATSAVRQHPPPPPAPQRPPPPPPPQRPLPRHQAAAPAPPPAAQPTFWTSCNKCKMNFEYLREYLNRNLLCPSCREPFIAKEVPMPPTEIVQAVRDSNIRGATEDASAGRKFQWGLFSRTAGPASATASSAAGTQAANMVHQTYEKVKREREEAQAAARREEALQKRHNALKRKANVSENVNHRMGDVASGKKMKTVGIDAGVGSSSILSGPWANYVGTPGGTIPFSTNSGAFEFQGANGVIPNWRPRPSTRMSVTRTFSKKDIRNILIDKMKSDLREKLKEIRSKPLQVTVNGKASEKHVVNEHVEGNETLASDDSTTNKDVCADPEENGSANSADAENEDDSTFSYTVPDPDFHDFDKDRTEESFQSDQIWASYDDEDGMPRYYAYIQKVISLNPFKVKISYLASRTNSEFGPLNWASSGFIKTCGDFRIGRYETVDIINMFSHQIKWEKGPRGVVKIYPQKGDIWALYRNWSPHWNGDTPDNVLHVYDLVEVQDDYDEDNGISVIPLIKLTGFRTVFQRHQDQDVIKRIPKGEMFRFSHQVPFYRMSGEEAPNVPKDSYEVDPAAISKELLQGITETVKEAEGTSKC